MLDDSTLVGFEIEVGQGFHQAGRRNSSARYAKPSSPL